MADINAVISLGFGSPASIEHVILFGLNAGEAPVVGDPILVSMVSRLRRSVTGESGVTRSATGQSRIRRSVTGTSEVD